MRRELARVIEELIVGDLSPGRRYEKLTTGHDLFSVRLNQVYRFVFQLYPDSGTALPVAVGPMTKPTVRPSLTPVADH